MEETVMDSATPYLPPEIIRSILKLLPVKFLIRFQLVCKDWKNLVKTPSFITEHLHHSTHQNPYLILEHFRRLIYDGPDPLCVINRDMQVLEYPIPVLLDRCVIIGSCNGLLCFNLTRYKILFLWNPAIRETFAVPQDFVKNESHLTSFVGFGFSPIVNDYKILRLLVSYDGRVHVVKVLSLSTWSWKEVEVTKLKSIRMICRTDGGTDGDFPFDGAIFWFGYKLVESNEIGILSFDIATEAFTLIPIPRSALASDFTCNLTTYKNKLTILSSTVIENDISSSTEVWVINLWVMEKSTDASDERWIWTKTYTSKPYSTHRALSAISIWRNEIVLESLVCRILFTDHDEKELVLCNLHTNEFKMLAINRFRPQAWNYVESLLSVATSTLKLL